MTRTTIRTDRSRQAPQVPLLELHVSDTYFYSPPKALVTNPLGLADQPQQTISPSSSPPENEPPEFLSHPPDISDEEEADYHKDRRQDQTRPNGKEAYDSRIQQLLYENPELEIHITDAGKSSDGGYIVYRIRTGVT